MKKWIALVVTLALLGLNASPVEAATVSERFPNDPVLDGRFISTNFGTETSFNFDSTNESLTAVLDVDRSIAYYVSTPPFEPVRNTNDVTFSFSFRVLEMDTRILPTAFIGLLTTNHVGLGGDGLTVALSSSTNGLPAISAAVDQGPFNFGGDALQLAFGTDFLAVGRYTASNLQFSVDIYGGSNFVDFIGCSTTFATPDRGFAVDRLGLQNGGGQSSDQTNGSITVVVDNLFTPGRPPINLSITNAIIDEPDTGTTNVFFPVVLSSASVLTVRVDYATMAVTALPDEDFMTTSGTLTFAPGVTTQFVIVPIIGDRIAEPTETFSVILSNVANANLIAAMAMGTILDKDVCLVALGDTGVAEMPSGMTNALFEVSLSLSNRQTVFVSFTTSNGTAVAGFDYGFTNGVLVFDPGVTNRIIEVTVAGDLLDEPTETFSIHLSNVTKALCGDCQGLGTITNSTPPPVVEVESTVFVTEGNIGSTSVLIQVSLSAASGRAITVCYATSNHTAFAGDDYLSTNDSITFSPGETNAAIVIRVFGDRVYELEEMFSLNLACVTNALLGHAQCLVVIQNDDPIPTISVADSGVLEGDAGMVNATFEVRLSNPTYQALTLDYFTVDGTARAIDDYLSTNGSLSFMPGATSQIVNVSILGDFLNEADETFTLELSNLVNVLPGRTNGTGVITNDDLICITNDEVVVLEGNAIGGTAVFTFRLSEPAHQVVSARYFTRSGTATNNSDFSDVTGLIVFPVGVTTQYVTVPITGDIVDEPDETFFIVLTDVTNASLCLATTNGVQGIIIDDDSPAVSMASVTLDEGSTGGFTEFRFTVTLSSAGTDNIMVNYATSDGTALAGSDYLATNGTVTIPPGVVMTNLFVRVVADTVREPDEAFFVGLNSPSNASIGSATATGTIVNDDSPVVDISGVIIIEGTCTNIQVSLSQTSSLPVIVPYCLGLVPPTLFLVCNSNCVSSQPTNLDAGCFSNCCTVTIPPGVLSTNFQLCALRNFIDETNRTYRPEGGEPTGGQKGTNGDIVVIDTDLPVILGGGAFVVEGDIGLTNLCFLIRLTTPHDTNVTVDFFTVDGTGRAGLDYLATVDTVMFPPGVTTQYACVPIIGETLFEIDETVIVILTNAINGILTNAVLAGTIINDDAPPALTISDATVLEGDTGTNFAVFTLTVLSPTSLDIAVRFAMEDVTATQGLDYTGSSGLLSIPATTNSATIQVPILGDLLDEFDETFLLQLAEVINATLVRSNAMGTIVDDDPSEIRVAGASVAEGHTNFTDLCFEIRLGLTNAGVVTVNFFTKDGTALAGLDYQPTNGPITFLPGETLKMICVPVLGDLIEEADETLFLCLTNPMNARLIDLEATGTIIDDDKPCISIGSATALEPAAGTTNFFIPITLNKPGSLPISVNFVLFDVTATAGTDFIGANGTLTIAPDVTNTNLVVVVNSDDEFEMDETFLVILFNPVNGLLCQPISVNNILDGTVRPTITVSDSSVREGNAGITNVVFTATLSKPSSQTVRLDFTTSDGSALAGLDYTTTGGTIVFHPGITTTNFAVPVLGDCELEADEFFVVNFTNAQLGTLGTAQVVGIITNDDAPPNIFITNAVVRERDLDQTNLVFTLALSCASSFTAAVHYATSDGTASVGSDYLAATGVVIFPPGVTLANITVPVLGDFELETNETLLVTLSNTNGALLATNQAVGTILDDDEIIVSILDAPPVNEGGAALFTVILSQPPSSDRTVNFASVDGTANATFDYNSTSNVLNFSAGVTNRTINVTTLADSLDELEEAFCVVLSNPTRASLGRAKAVGTIIDANLPCVFVNDVSVRDDGTGNLPADFRISLSSTSSLPITVRYSTTNGTAIAGPDYVPASGSLTIPAGQTNGTIHVSVLGNTQDETNEFFCVLLSMPTNATFCKPKGVCTIFNGTNVNLPPIVSLTNPPPGLCLIPPTNLLLAATASDPDGLVLRVDFYANLTNFIGRSFTPPHQILWINVPPGFHELTAVALDNAEKTGTSAPVQLFVSLPATNSIADTSVLEGSGGTNAVFVVSLAAPSCRTVSVEAYTADGTARAGFDYLPLSITNLIFQPGVTQLTVAVPIIDDSVIEDDETFFLILTNSFNTVIAAPGIGVCTIKNDDTNVAPTVTITSPQNSDILFVPPSFAIVADARDSDGYVTQVDFFASGVFIGRDTNLPFALPWTNAVPNPYVLTAIATDNSGARATSAPVSIVVSNCTGLLTNRASLLDRTNCSCDEPIFTTDVSSPDPVTYLWRLNGQLLSGETGRSLRIQSLKSAYAGRYSVEIRTPCRAITNSANMVVEESIMQTPVSYTNSARITINFANAAPATPITVKCVSGPLTNLTVTVFGLSHAFPGDIDLWLLSPNGRALKLMSDVQDDPMQSVSFSNLTFTFSDAAPSKLSEANIIVSGTYQPTDRGIPAQDTLPPGTISVVTNLASFRGISPNGKWQLFARDDFSQEDGFLANGWSMTVAWDPFHLGPARFVGGHVEVMLFSQAGRTHLIEASTDLRQWFPLRTNLLQSGTSTNIVLPDSNALPHRFYRASCCLDLFQNALPLQPAAPGTSAKDDSK